MLYLDYGYIIRRANTAWQNSPKKQASTQKTSEDEFIWQYHCLPYFVFYLTATEKFYHAYGVRSNVNEDSLTRISQLVSDVWMSRWCGQAAVERRW
jgi:hypothetical protein